MVSRIELERMSRRGVRAGLLPAALVGSSARPSPRHHRALAKNGGEVWTAAGKSQDDFMLKDECILLDFADNVIGHDNRSSL